MLSRINSPSCCAISVHSTVVDIHQRKRRASHDLTWWSTLDGPEALVDGQIKELTACLCQRRSILSPAAGHYIYVLCTEYD